MKTLLAILFLGGVVMAQDVAQLPVKASTSRFALSNFHLVMTPQISPPVVNHSASKRFLRSFMQGAGEAMQKQSDTPQLLIMPAAPEPMATQFKVCTSQVSQFSVMTECF